MSAPFRSLLLVDKPPWPARGGHDLRMAVMAAVLAELGPTFVFALTATGPTALPSGITGLQVSRDPEAARAPRGDDFLAALQDVASPLAPAVSETVRRELADLAASFSPQLVVIGGLELSAYAADFAASGCRTVLDLDHGRARTMADMATTDPNRSRGRLWRHMAARVARDEAARVAQFRDVWVCAADERPWVLEQVDPGATVAVVPNVVDVAWYSESLRNRPDRDREPSAPSRTLVYPARFDYWPNEEAARVLVDAVLPALVDAELRLVGRSPTAWMRAITDPQVTVTGPVPDVRPHLAAASVVPVPLTAGAGTRIKVLEACAAGVPVVSTAKGVEGLELEAGVHYLHAETPPEMAAAIAHLWASPGEADGLIAAARTEVERRFGLAALRRAMGEALGSRPS